MVCLYTRGDNPRALEGGISPEHVDNHGITILYTLLRCRPWGKGGINLLDFTTLSKILCILR